MASTTGELMQNKTGASRARGTGNRSLEDKINPSLNGGRNNNPALDMNTTKTTLTNGNAAVRDGRAEELLTQGELSVVRCLSR